MRGAYYSQENIETASNMASFWVSIRYISGGINGRRKKVTLHGHISHRKGEKHRLKCAI